ncbi:M28 family metallopeptidase [Roseivirga echinicomitans]
MIRKTTFFSTLILLISFNAFSFQQKGIPEQVDLISKLTGHSAIQGTTVLHDRHALESRKIVAEFLKDQLSEFIDQVEIENYSETGNNVVGTIMATTKTDEWVILGAHFDSVKDSPGANDNASGTALVYSVAKHIADLNTRKYNVKIVFFDEEERGLIGSKAYANKLKEENFNIVSVHTIDQMGWDDDGDRAFELEMPTEELKNHYLQVAKDFGFDFPIHMSKVTSTDHRSFRNVGFNATGLTEEYVNKDTTPHYHKSTDTFETINFEYLKTITDYVKKVFEELLK